MIITISGVKCGIDKVSVTTKGFGKAPDAVLGLPYILLIRREQIGRDFMKYYDDYIQDIKTYGLEDDETVARSLQALQFPSWLDLLEKHPDTARIFLQEVVYDFLNSTFLHTNHERPLYFIKTVESVEMGTEHVTLVGQVLNYRRMLLDKIGDDMTESVPCKEVGYGFSSGQDENDN